MATMWRKLKRLGAGAYGQVYLVAPMESSNSGSSVSLAAVKSADVRLSASLQQEAMLLSELRGYPNIIQCFGSDLSKENGKSVYNLLLEYAPEGSLHDLIQKNRGTIPESIVACYTMMLLRGLSGIHEEDIVHCDIKPGNILVFPKDKSGIYQLKIADFGLAQKVSQLSKLRRMGKKGRGTKLYASPEALMDGLQETGYDIWSLGCTVVEMMTGKRMWSSCEDECDIRFNIMHEEPKIPEDISPDGKDFLSSCFERKLSKRWTADMLLSHPFIVNNMRLLYGTHDPCCRVSGESWINPFGRSDWTATTNLFSRLSLEPRCCLH